MQYLSTGIRELDCPLNRGWPLYILKQVAAYSTVRLTVDNIHFKIQLGECWSGSEAGETYNRAGTSDKCVTKNYTKCNPNDNQECVGDQNVNFVYGIDVKGDYSLYLAFLFAHSCLSITLVLVQARS